MGLARGRPTWALALLVCVLLRLPAFAQDVLSDDEAIYDAMGQVIASGGVMYRDTVDHKPPGLAYTYAAAAAMAGWGSMWLVHLIGLLVALGTTWGVGRAARHLLGEERAAVAAFLYAVGSTAMQPVDGLAVNGELMMNLPTILALVLALEAARVSSAARRALADLGVGALCAIAALYKYQAAVLFLALPLLATRRDWWQRLPVWGIGAAVPPLLVGLYFHSQGALDEALTWGIAFNFSYVSEGPPLWWAAGRLGGQMLAVVLPSALFYGAGLWTFVRLLRRRAVADVVAGRVFLVVWTVLCCGAVATGGRFFGHYFLQLEVPLALLAGAPLARMWAKWPRRTAAALLAPAVVFSALAAFPGFSTRLLNAEDPDFEALGSAVRAITAEHERIWVWGNVPQIYRSSRRLHGVRFTFCNYLTGLSPATPSEHDPKADPFENRVRRAESLALRDLEVNRPALIVDTSTSNTKSYGKFPLSRLPTVSAFVAAHYHVAGTVLGMTLYRLRDAVFSPAADARRHAPASTAEGVVQAAVVRR